MPLPPGDVPRRGGEGKKSSQSACADSSPKGRAKLAKWIPFCKSLLQIGVFDARIIMTKYVYKRKRNNGCNL